MDATVKCGAPRRNTSLLLTGFSLLNISKKQNARGASSAINNCMRELVSYAGRCTGSDGRPGPEIVSFESVQGAYSQGRELMLELRDTLNNITEGRYHSSVADVPSYAITHVLMSGGSIGAAQMRHRYFPVFHRIPFGVDPPRVEDLPDQRVVTYEDAIGDLQKAKLQWEDQKYRRKSKSEFASRLRRDDGLFDAHVVHEHERTHRALEELADGWRPGLNMAFAAVELGVRPEAMEKAYEGDEKKSYRGFRWPTRIRPNRCGYVLTGGAINEYVHWSEPRFLTVRECSRLMGYPDAWRWPTGKPNTASMWIGKCCPCDSGRWISRKFKAALEEAPECPGEQIGPGEYKHNYTLLYKRWPGGDVPPREPR